MALPKSIKRGNAIEVQREVGESWEPAMYRERVEDMRGWHIVDLDPSSPARFVNSMDGAEVSDRERSDLGNVRAMHSFATRFCMVPSQRARLRR